ncbi:unnamed protein product [Chrysoparadoxa australica]
MRDISSDEERLIRTKSRERLKPSFASRSRTGSVSGAVVNLISTILGGGVLSIPYALRLTGLVPGLVMLLVTAAASDYSVYTLVSCSRRSGAQTFEGVAEAAFGRSAKMMTMLLVICVTYLPMVAYTILLRDLTSPILEMYAMDETQMTMHGRNVLMSLLVLVVSPTCLITNLDPLKTLSMFSIFSILVLALTVLYRATTCDFGGGSPIEVDGLGLARSALRLGVGPGGIMNSGDASGTKIEDTIAESDEGGILLNWWPLDGLQGLLQGVPIFVCAFVCHFNVLPVHGLLREPTRQRLHRMVHWTMGTVTLFYALIGLSGYVYFVRVGEFQDNILNGFGADDALVNLGRLGLVFTVMLSLPLMVTDVLLKMNDSLVTGVNVRYHFPLVESEAHQHIGISLDERGRSGVLSIVSPRRCRSNTPANEVTCPSRCSITLTPCTYSLHAGNSLAVQASTAAVVPFLPRLVATYWLLGTAVLMAGTLAQVSVVWGVLGSSANMLVAFVLPCAAYNRIRVYRNRSKTGYRKPLASLLLVVSSLLVVACTFTNTQALLSG